jgi:hypothetical protein
MANIQGFCTTAGPNFNANQMLSLEPEQKKKTMPFITRQLIIPHQSSVISPRHIDLSTA